MINLVKHPRTAADSSGHRGALHTKRRNRTPTENEDRVQDNIQDVGQDKRTHRQRSVTGAAKDTVDEEQQHDDNVAGQHHLGISGVVSNKRFAATHQAQKMFRVKDPYKTYKNGKPETNVQ